MLDRMLDVLTVISQAACTPIFRRQLRHQLRHQPRQHPAPRRAPPRCGATKSRHERHRFILVGPVALLQHAVLRPLVRFWAAKRCANERVLSANSKHSTIYNASNISVLHRPCILKRGRTEVCRGVRSRTPLRAPVVDERAVELGILARDGAGGPGVGLVGPGRTKASSFGELLWRAPRRRQEDGRSRRGSA